jgi:hypothetical protein
MLLAIVAIVLSFISPVGTLMVAMLSIGIGVVGVLRKDKTSLIGIVLTIIPLILLGKNLITDTKKVTDVVLDSYVDTYAINAKGYVNNVELAVRVNEIKCKSSLDSTEYTKVNELGDGEYYFFISTDKDVLTKTFKDFDKTLAEQIEAQTKSLTESPVKSSWSSRELFGWVHWTKAGTGISYYLALTDDFGHGISEEVKKDKITGSIIETKDAKADLSKLLQTIKNPEEGKTIYYCTMD